MGGDELLMHCANFGCGKALRGFIQGDWGLPEGTAVEELAAGDHVPPATALPSVQSVEQALALLEKGSTLAVGCLAAAGEEELLGRTLRAPRGGPKTSLFQHLLHVIAHLAQHKGQLFYYLKLMGSEAATGDPWGA